MLYAVNKAIKTNFLYSLCVILGYRLRSLSLKSDIFLSSKVYKVFTILCYCYLQITYALLQ